MDRETTNIQRREIRSPVLMSTKTLDGIDRAIKMGTHLIILMWEGEGSTWTWRPGGYKYSRTRVKLELNVEVRDTADRNFRDVCANEHFPQTLLQNLAL